MDQLGDEDVVYLAAYILLKPSIRRKEDEKARKKENYLCKADLQAKRKIWYF